MKMKAVSLYLPEDLVERINTLAEQKNISRSELVSMILDETVKPTEREVLANVVELHHLPKTLINVPLDHPIFRKGKLNRGPFEVSVFKTKH